MSLHEFLKAQKEIQDRLYPPALKGYLKAQQKLKDALYPPQVQNIIESQNKFKTLFEYQFKNIKPIWEIPTLNNPNIDSYINSFKVIENLKKHFEVSPNLKSYLDFTYKKYDFFNFIVDLQEEEVEEIETVIVEETKSIKRIITDIYKDNSNLLKIEPRQFEEMIAEILYSKGFKIELTKQTRDNGFDIIALKTLENNFPLKFLVECKRFTERKVGVEIIRSFKEVIQTENANKGILVTTSYFTKEAKKKQLETPYLLDYKDKDDVLTWVTEYCDK